MSSPFYPAFQKAFQRHVRGQTPRPDPLVLRVQQPSPLTLFDSDGLQLEFQSNFDSLFTSALENLKKDDTVEIRAWRIAVQLGNNKVTGIFVTATQLLLHNSKKKGHLTEKDCSLNLQVYPRYPPSILVQKLIKAIQKKSLKPLNQTQSNLITSIVFKSLQANDSPQVFDQGQFKLQDDNLRILKKLTLKIKRQQLFGLLEKEEHVFKKEMRMLILENDPNRPGHKRRYDRADVLALLQE